MVLRTLTTNTKKRKSTGTLEPPKSSKHGRRTTLDAYFAPVVQVTTHSPEGEETCKFTLNDEQRDVLRMVVEEGKSVFFTGSAGTGKSLLLRGIIAALRKKFSKNPDVVSVTASTGMAASNIGGMTLHAWGAVAPTVQNLDLLVSYIKKCRPALQRWKTTEVLIIDEISMVDGHLFDTLAALATRLRKKTDKPFGGMQLIVTGDFFQLPPISKGIPFFTFESEAWKNTLQHTVTLTQVYRQTDSRFVDLLNELRKGTISSDALSTFKSLSRPLPPHASGILPTELFPLRAEVERANASRLSALPSTSHTFTARDSGTAPEDKRSKLLANMMAMEKVELKVDAQVMLIKNVDERLVNGTVGKVLGFYPLLSVQSSTEGTTKGTGEGSSKKAYANANGHVRNVLLAAGGKTPLVPVKRPKEEKENDNAQGIKPSSKGKEKEKEFELFPLVEFCTAQGKEVVLVVRDEFTVEDNEGKVLARRVQIPLILAWAMSIHKSQGQTIQRVKIDLGRVFEKGQSYVALSRAASLDGLQVLRFDPKKVMAHPKVIEWSKTLQGGGSSKSIASVASDSICK